MPAVARTAILVAGIGLAACFEVLAGPDRIELILPVVVVAGGFLLLAVSASSRNEAVLAAAVTTTWLLADLLPFTAFWHRAIVVHLIVQVAWRGRLPRAARVLVGAS